MTTASHPATTGASWRTALVAGGLVLALAAIPSALGAVFVLLMGLL